MIHTCSIDRAEAYLSSVLAFELESLVTRSAHFWLVGGPRAGKTTLALSLSERWAQVTGDAWRVRHGDSWIDGDLDFEEQGRQIGEWLKDRKDDDSLILEGCNVAWAPMRHRVPDVLVYLAGTAPGQRRSRGQRSLTSRVFNRFVDMKHPRKLIIHNAGAEWAREVGYE